MRTRRHFIGTMVLLSATVTSASALKCANPARGDTHDVADNAGLELHLEALNDGLAATLINRSAVTRRILYDSDIQPSRLVLLGADSKPARSFDERTRRKIDRQVSNGMYTEIAPGQRVEIERVQFDKESDGYTASWGPFRFSELRAGLWKARVSFDSRIDWVTSGGREVPAANPVWTGKLISNEVALRLR